MKRVKNIGLFILAVLFANASFAQMEKTVIVGGADMYPSKNIIQNAVNSKDHTTLVAAVKAAELVETLSGAGPFTVFAPVNSAFDMLPKETVETLLMPENKAMLSGILTYHVVSGSLGSKDLMNLVKDGKGTATLNTVAGGKLFVTRKGNKLMIKDEKGGLALLTTRDVYQSNGVIHVINKVLLPK